MGRKKSWIERFFSFNQHRKRFGARKFSSNLAGVDYQLLKSQIIDGSDPIYTHGSEKNIGLHIENLRHEFSGQSELLYFHAQLIVMIRREYRAREHYSEFEHLWEAESEFLLNNLNTRWLVSAADTFSDLATDPTVRSLALCASILANTVKIQETERYLQGAGKLNDKPEILSQLSNERVPLFDGMSAFAVGTDDTLRNMRWRMNEISKLHIPGLILMEIFKRFQNHETVFQRMRQRHTRDRTSWWN